MSICLEAFPNDNRTLYGLPVLSLLTPKNDAILVIVMQLRNNMNF